MSALPHIGNDEKLELGRAATVINQHEPVDFRAAATIDLCIRYVEARHEGLSHHNAVVRMGRLLVEWYPGSAPPEGWPTEDEVPPTPPQPTHPDPLKGQLHIDNRSYADDTGPRLPVFLHAMDLIGHALVRGVEAVIPTLDMAAKAGYHGLRSGFQLKITTGTWIPGPTQDGWDPRTNPSLFKQTLVAGIERGLKWNLVGLGIRGLDDSAENEIFDLVGTVMSEIGPEHVALVVAANEVRDTGDADDQDPNELARLVNRIGHRFPRGLYGLSAYTGTEDKDTLRRYTPDWMKFCLIHNFRGGRVHDKLRHCFTMGYEDPVRPLYWADEPWGVGRLVSASDNKHELDAHAMKLSACMAVMAHHAWTFMSGPGIVLGNEPWEAMPGLMDTPGVVRQLPQDLMRFKLGHSGRPGTRIHAVRGDAPNVRADYGIAPDGRFVEIIHGPPDQPHDLPQERATRDVRVIETGPWGTCTTGQLV